ncbi:hypothetical protein PIB30_074814 [Stylosanthes scabra]|uniref:Uncharacterized protein n=1 Tax=Stylosanthes scabra TaxID=79078 RepID=A0ABU6YNR2_9FABA|nr:hypothetical protein [Stylosanthes scabra]
MTGKKMEQKEQLKEILPCYMLVVQLFKERLGVYKTPHQPSQQKEEVAISPIPAEEEKKKKEPAAYRPKSPYPQRLKAENKNKAPKKEPKEEKGATNDSVKFQQIQTVPTMPYLPTILGSNNMTYMITEGVCNKFFVPP